MEQVVSVVERAQTLCPTSGVPHVQIKAIFDLDGTILNSNDMHVEAWHQAFAQIGKTFNRADIHDQIRKGADMLVPTVLDGH